MQPMKPQANTSWWRLNQVAGLGISTTLLLGQVAHSQSIPNPSFEANTFATAPGYVSDNTAITGWTADPTTGAGLNPAGGGSQFANNGAIPDGANVAFLSAAGSKLSTTLSGLTAGKTYSWGVRLLSRGGIPIRMLSDGRKFTYDRPSSGGGGQPIQPPPE